MWNSCTIYGHTCDANVIGRIWNRKIMCKINGFFFSGLNISEDGANTEKYKLDIVENEEYIKS